MTEPENGRPNYQLIAASGFATYYFSTLSELLDIVEFGDRNARYLALAGVGTFVLTHLLFLFVIFLPWICAINPNFAAWRDSRPLSMVVPTMTLGLPTSQVLLMVTLGKWGTLDYGSAFIAAASLHVLCLMLWKLIPPPHVH